MKTKTFFLTILMFVILLIGTTGMHAQTVQSNLDQLKLMQQMTGTWEATYDKDTVEVMETQQYGKSFITTVSYNIKGKKTPLYTNNYCFDSKEGKFKGFALGADGSYGTWIGLWTTEKKFNVDAVQNFKPEIVLYKIELVYETPAKMTWTDFKTDGTKTGELKYTKVK